MSDTAPQSNEAPFPAGWLMAAASAAALVLMIIEYFIPHGTIAHSWGTLLVIISTALMLMAALLIELAGMSHEFIVLFEILIVLDIIGTAICAYFLESYLLLALTVVVLIGWAMRISGPPLRDGVSRR